MSSQDVETARLREDGGVLSSYGSGTGSPTDVDIVPSEAAGGSVPDASGSLSSSPARPTNSNTNTSSSSTNSSSTTSRSTHNNDNSNDNSNGGNNGNNDPNLPAGADAADVPAGPYDDAVEDVVTSLTRRVRCLFSIITWPIVPLGTVASLALGWLIYASFVLDVGKSCSHPLHWYAILSLVLVMYAPYHSRIRSFLFNYQRDRGSERPPGVRRYDQLFHTLALIYVYAGITLVQTCRDDIQVIPTPPTGAATAGGDADGMNGTIAPPINTCSATCPHLFDALRVYVATIEIFTFSLILPLLFLPCLYLYFIRRTMQDAESLAILQDRFREEEALMRNGGVTAQEIMDQFEIVKLVADTQTNDTSDSDDARILVVKEGGQAATAEECHAKECCICMEPFFVTPDESENCDEELANASTINARDDSLQVIRTRTCGHMFHRRCIASWVGGRWNTTNNDSNDNGREMNRRARRTTCPLCRQDVRLNR